MVDNRDSICRRGGSVVHFRLDPTGQDNVTEEYQAVKHCFFSSCPSYLRIVDVNNRRCLNLINKLPIDEIDNSQWHSSTNGLKPKVFSCPLSTISFKHR